MAACPYCAEEIPGNVSVCPFCNSELGAGAARNRPGPPKSGGGAATVLIILAVLGGGFLVCGGVAVALLMPVVQTAGPAARQSQSKNNLKQIGLAFHNYHDVYATLPPGGVVDAVARAHHGWGAALLPFVEQAPLYNQIDFNVPWDDAVNSGAYMAPVITYQNPGVSQTIHPTGYGISHYAGNSRVLFENSSVRFGNVTDGLSNTILAGEVGEGFKAWGDPTNVRDPALGINSHPDGFGSPAPDGAHVLMMDGSVRFINQNIDAATLESIATPAGGEVIPEY